MEFNKVEMKHPPYCRVLNRNLRAPVRVSDTEGRFMTVWDLLELDARE